MSTHHDTQYIKLAKRVLTKGVDRRDRTGTGTRSLFGQQLRFDLSAGFPLLTTKQVPFKTVAKELLWFLSGSTNIRPLVLQDVKIWNEWPYKLFLKKHGFDIPPTSSDEWRIGLADFIKKIVEDEDFANLHGDLGPVYGSQWRKWRTPEGTVIDQIVKLVTGLVANPESRDHIVTAWNPSDHELLRGTTLPPCHYGWQCCVANSKLTMIVNQRSCDVFLGVPFNIASYAILCHMLARVTGLAPGELVWNGGDVHIYNNHFDAMAEQLTREPLPSPTLEIIGDVDSIDDFTLENFSVNGYCHQGKITAPIAV